MLYRLLIVILLLTILAGQWGGDVVRAVAPDLMARYYVTSAGAFDCLDLEVVERGGTFYIEGQCDITAELERQ